MNQLTLADYENFRIDPFAESVGVAALYEAAGETEEEGIFHEIDEVMELQSEAENAREDIRELNQWCWDLTGDWGNSLIYDLGLSGEVHDRLEEIERLERVLNLRLHHVDILLQRRNVEYQRFRRAGGRGYWLYRAVQRRAQRAASRD